ncbi:hypothetical protein ACWD4B_13335 [Streptomyces sp. NPDC002536]
MSQLKEALPGSAQADRRMRDLREDDWVIETHRTRVTLQPSELLFVRAGKEIWDPVVRAELQLRPKAIEVAHRAIRMEPFLQVASPPNPDAVWARLEGLSPRERSLLLAWMAMGRRPSSRAELAWRAYRGLSEDQRHDLMVKLGELVSDEVGDEDAMQLPAEGSEAP